MAIKMRTKNQNMDQNQLIPMASELFYSRGSVVMVIIKVVILFDSLNPHVARSPKY